jgi:hypothetical protein
VEEKRVGGVEGARERNPKQIKRVEEFFRSKKRPPKTFFSPFFAYKCKIKTIKFNQVHICGA